jgi:RNB domain
MPAEETRGDESIVEGSGGPVSIVGAIPIEIAAPIVKKLSQLDQDINAFRRRHALAFDGLYDILADESKLVECSLQEIAPQAFGMPYDQLGTAGLLAIERFALNGEHGIFCSRLGLKFVTLWVRSRRDMRIMEQVTQWARDYQEAAAKAALSKDVKEDLRKNPLTAFISKVHRIILRSRKIRSPTTIGVLGPSADSGDGLPVRAVDTGETLTKNDQDILQYLFDASEMLPPLVPMENHSICALIYRAIGAYPNITLGKKVARLLNQELGVTAPWSTRMTNRYVYKLPGTGIWPYQDKLLADAQASCKEMSAFRDSVSHLRKDWGNMPVYCIDAGGAFEIDDGISIQLHPGMPDCAWIHVHVANPAAYISPDHPIAVAAADIATSTYTPSRAYRMMPDAFTSSVASLGPDRSAMTFSTLLRANGSIADVQVSFGTVRNVIQLTHRAVDGALGHVWEEEATMIVGGERMMGQEDKVDQQALESALPDLLLMKRFLLANHEARLKAWPVEERIADPKPNKLRVDAWTNFTEEELPVSAHRLRHWKGDPIIAIGGSRHPRLAYDTTEMAVVELAMLLAGEAAASWCKDRNIPILYQVATPHALFPISKINKLKEGDFRIEPAGRLSTKPEPHWPLMMQNYTKLTSPIRRYPDLINQWQIQAFLVHDGAKSQHVEGTHSVDMQSKLPFSCHELEDLVETYSTRLGLHKRLSDMTTDHWVIQALFRAHHFKEAELPDVWDIVVKGPRFVLSIGEGPVDRTGIMGVLVPFQGVAELLSSKEGWERQARRQQFLPVKIEVVDMEAQSLFVRAVGPPSDKPTTTHPIHIRPKKQSNSDLPRS